MLLTHPQFPFSQIPLLVLGNRIRNTNLEIFQGTYHWVKLMQSVPAFIHNYALKAISDPWNVTSFDISPAYEKYMVKETYHTAGDFLGKFTECLVDEMSLENLYTVGYSCKKLTTWVISHISRKLNCRGRCQIVAWYHHQHHIKANRNFVANSSSNDISFASFIYVPWCAAVKACSRFDSAASQSWWWRCVLFH